MISHDIIRIKDKKNLEITLIELYEMTQTFDQTFQRIFKLDYFKINFSKNYLKKILLLKWYKIL